MSEHSPLPWSADTTEPGELWIADSRRLSPVCMITGSGNVTERDRADAAFIVKAIFGEAADIRNLGDVKWIATEDQSIGKGTGRHIACFILRAHRSDRGSAEA